MSYSYSYSYSYSDFLNQFSQAQLIIMGIACLVVTILTIIAEWKMFEKAGEAGWKAIIPIYNSYILTKIAAGNGWMFLLLLIPFANFVFMIWLFIQLSKAYGYGIGFAIGLILLTAVFYCILGFGNSEYVGPKGQSA